MFKKDFPYFNNTKTTYLDNAATTQKPKSVIDSQVHYYTNYCANTHRSSFSEANKATVEFENTRKTLQTFINAKNSEEIIFTKGVTESINFVASSFAKEYKTVIISSLEHHSNIIPWHMQGRKLHDGLEVVECKSDLSFDTEHFKSLLDKHPNSFVSITHISNAFGVIHNIKTIIELSHKKNCVVMIDGAQSLAHTSIDVQDLDVDFFVISAHKTFGPTGVGAIYAKEKYLHTLKPYQTGGATIKSVDYGSSSFLDAPYKFEAGTQNIAGVVGFGKALEYLNHITYEEIKNQEKQMQMYLVKELSQIKDIEFYNDISTSIGSISFNIKGILHDDIGILLSKMNIALRVGHHCAEPIMKKLGLRGTIRVSIAFYTSKDDIDTFITALKKAYEMLKG